MLRQTRRKTALALVCLLFAIGGIALATHPDRESISFDAVLEIWSSIVRDVDRFGLTITQISPEREMEIGREIGEQIAAEYGESVPSDQADYVRDVGQALVPFAERHRITYSFRLIDAFAFPGGQIYVTTGMLDFAQSEAELAAVLGHEISHVDLKHCVERLQYELAVRRVAGDDMASIVRIGYRLVQLGFSEQQEIEADVNGVILAAKGGYDPRQSIAIYERLGALEAERRQPEQESGTVAGEIGGALVKALESYFATHPPAALRVPAIKKAIARNAAGWRGREFYVGRRNYEKWRARSRLDIPEERIKFAP
jgi:predicted Zn-dependent protease